MPQANTNEVPMYGSDDIVVAYCMCSNSEVKPHKEFVFHVPASGVFPVICNKCNLEIKKGDLK